MGIETINNSKKMDSKITTKLKKDKIQLPPSKVVIRKLPPTFTDEDLQNAIAPVPDNNYFYFVPGDKRLGKYSFSRAYINFINTEEIFIFRDKFDGYVFVDQKGNEYPAIVEYAPFQKIPKTNPNQKKDTRCGTIDEDEDYLKFLDNLENPETVTLAPIETLLEEIETLEREIRANHGILKVKTPLLEFIEQRNANKFKLGDRKRRKDLERKQMREEAKKKRKENVREWKYGKKEDVQIREEKKKKDDDKFKYKDRISKEKDDKEKRPRKDIGSKPSFKTFETDGGKKRPERSKLPDEEDEPLNPEIKKISNLEKRDCEIKPKSSPSDSVRSKRYSEVRKREERKVKSEVTEEKTMEKPLPEEEPEVLSNKPEECLSSTENEVTNSQTESNNRNSDDDNKNSDCESRKKAEARNARRIKNKDRPAMQLYRPGQSRLKSSQTKRDDKGNFESSSSSSSPDMAFVEDTKDESSFKKKEVARSYDKKTSKMDLGAEERTKSNKENFKRDYDECKENVNKVEEKGFGKYKEDSGRYDSRTGGAGSGPARKGYSYHQEREHKAKLRGKDQESKPSNYRRSTSQE